MYPLWMKGFKQFPGFRQENFISTGSSSASSQGLGSQEAVTLLNS